MHNASVPFARHCRLPEHPALASPPPRQSGSLHLAPDQRLIAVADYDNDTVTLRSLDGARAAMLSRITRSKAMLHRPSPALEESD
jgi:hypothetical protein